MLLYEGNGGTFNIGSRVNVPFIEAAGNDSFKHDAHTLALRAKAEVENLRSRFSTIEEAALYYRDSDRRHAWDDYCYGVLLVLGCDMASAKVAFESVPTHHLEFAWEKALAQRAAELHKLASNHTVFIETIRDIVLRTRSIGSLPEWDQTWSSVNGCHSPSG